MMQVTLFDWEEDANFLNPFRGGELICHISEELFHLL